MSSTPVTEEYQVAMARRQELENIGGPQVVNNVPFLAQFCNIMYGFSGVPEIKRIPCPLAPSDALKFVLDLAQVNPGGWVHALNVSRQLIRPDLHYAGADGGRHLPENSAGHLAAQAARNAAMSCDPVTSQVRKINYGVKVELFV